MKYLTFLDAGFPNKAHLLRKKIIALIVQIPERFYSSEISAFDHYLVSLITFIIN